MAATGESIDVGNIFTLDTEDASGIAFATNATQASIMRYGYGPAVFQVSTEGYFSAAEDKEYTGEPGSMKPVVLLESLESVSGEEIKNRIKKFLN